MAAEPISIQGKHNTHLFRRIGWSEIDTAYLKQLVALAKVEDLEGAGLLSVPIKSGDVTTQAIEKGVTGCATLVARQSMVVCGIGLVPLILEAYGEDASFEPACKDGDCIEKGTALGSLSGAVATLLQAERIILNFLQHLSGVATQTQRYVQKISSDNTKLLDTRKTTPGFRVLEKYAVACGGGWNHRIGLFDRVMLKDNHLAASEAVSGKALSEAVVLTREKNPTLAIEVEVDSLEQIPPVLEAGADVIMLDNFSLEDLKQAIELIGKKAYTEASGGITLETLPEISEIEPDFISCGALIHQSQWVDIGLDWV